MSVFSTERFTNNSFYDTLETLHGRVKSAGKY